MLKSNYKKNKLLQGSEQQNMFQAQTSFHHDKQYGFIMSVENVILTNIHLLPPITQPMVPSVVSINIGKNQYPLSIMYTHTYC